MRPPALCEASSVERAGCGAAAAPSDGSDSDVQSCSSISCASTPSSDSTTARRPAAAAQSDDDTFDGASAGDRESLQVRGGTGDLDDTGSESDDPKAKPPFLARLLLQLLGCAVSVWTWLLLSTLLTLMAMGAGAMVIAAPCQSECPPAPECAIVFAFLVASLIAGVAGAFLLCIGGGVHVLCAASFALLNWAFGLIQGLFEASSHKVLPLTWDELLYLSFLTYFGMQLALEAILVLRIQALEAAAHKPWCRVSARGLWCMLCVQLVPWLMMCGFMIAQWLRLMEGARTAMLVDYSQMAHHLMFFTVMSTCIGCLGDVLRQLRRAERAAEAAGPAAARGLRALQQVRCAVSKQLIGASCTFLLLCLGACMSWLNWAMLHGYMGEGTISASTVNEVLIVTQILDICFNTFSAVVLSGGYRARRSKTPLGRRVAKSYRRACHRMRFGSKVEPMLRRAARLRSRDSERLPLCLDAPLLPSGPTWMGKVEELAHRGITLGELLSFYKKLGSAYMPNYRPGVHTTADVVRRAVLPITKGARASYAEVATGGRPPWPRKMVTHNWGNLFRDLVAAVVADALDEGSFKMIARLLEEDPWLLESLLSESGKLTAAYWICAFSVNQHAGPCNIIYPGSLDPVTREPHQPCDCGLDKRLNDSPPLTPDGRSIACEMNKFDDMMGFLAEHRCGFEQVIATDAQFRLFHRAWCVGELAKARDLRLLQWLKLPTKMSLGENERQLRTLRVEEMQASRREDVDEILSKIVDKTAFNNSLQELLFGRHSGLLATWRELDAQRQMMEAGRLLRWASADGGSGVVWRCWED